MSDTTTRLWVALFVLVVFVCGLSLGVAANAWWAPEPGSRRGPFSPDRRAGGPTGPPGFSERILERLESDPEFSEEQRARVEALFAERRDRFRQLNRDMRARFETERARLHADLAAILTPAQMEVFDESRRRRRPWRREGGGRQP